MIARLVRLAATIAIAIVLLWMAFNLDLVLPAVIAFVADVPRLVNELVEWATGGTLRDLFTSSS